MDFYQQAPELKNQYTDDRVLRSYLEKNISADHLKTISRDLTRFGQRVVTDILQMNHEVENSPPVHVPYNPWGKRVDEVKVSESWKKLDRVSAEEGIVAIGYEREFGDESRLYQFAKLYLFHPSSGMYSCPLAMTDGAAKLIESSEDDGLKQKAFKRLTSRDPSHFWTSGQWMTERTGGSDVSGTSTVAKLEQGTYRLYGAKWFTSATTSQMCMTLARIEGDPSNRLSLFYVELRNEKGELQNIQINRLKDKMGTKGLPTAELTLDGTPAQLVGEIGKGVKTISTLFNVTRLYNACCAVGYMRRGIALARSYAEERVAFGKKLSDHGLHMETLADLQVRFELSFHLTFHAVKILGKEELKTSSSTETGALRLLIPLVKLFTAKEGVNIASEIIESFGGAGYIEDTGLPSILRNAQVLAIWEGTTNVLSLDALRAIKKENAGEELLKDLRERMSRFSHKEILDSAQSMGVVLAKLEEDLRRAKTEDSEDVNSEARFLAMNLSRVYGVALMLEHAEWELKQHKKSLTLLSANRTLMKGLYHHEHSSAKRQLENRELLQS